MPRVILLLIILYQAAPSRAVIPLELVAEFEILQDYGRNARSKGWDTQHFFGDSTTTFVWLGRNDSLFYDLGIGQGIGSVHLRPPDSIPDGFGFRYYEYPMIYKDSSSLDVPSVIVIAVLLNGAIRIDRAFKIDLATGEATSEAFDVAGYELAGPSQRAARYVRHEVWPSLPAVTQKLVVQNSVSASEALGDTGNIDRELGEVKIYDVPPFSLSSLHDSCTAFAVLPSHEQFNVAFGAGEWWVQEWECEDSDDGWCWHNRFLRAVHSSVGNPITVCAVECSTGTSCEPYGCYYPYSISAATDAAGNNYGILDTVCYDLNSGEVVWRNPTLLPTFAGFCYPTPDQQKFFHKNWGSNTFNVYEPATGQLIDVTSNYAGIYSYKIRVPGHLDQFVTYLQPAGSSTGVIRVFRLVNPIPQQLAILYSAENNQFRLEWNFVYSASSYEVCRSRFADVDFCEQDVISVADTFLILPLIDGINKEFFRVRAVFD